MSGKNLGPETIAVIDAIRATEDMAQKYYQGAWTLERVGKTDIYKVYITNPNRFIEMTGGDLMTQLQIPFPHRWLRIHFYHISSVVGPPYLPSTLYMRITIRRETVTSDPYYASDELFCEFNINHHIIQEQFGVGWEYEAGPWNVILNAPATEGVIPLFYIQKLKTVGK